MTDNASSRPVWLTWILRHKIISALVGLGVLVAIGLVNPSGPGSSTTDAPPTGLTAGTSPSSTPLASPTASGLATSSAEAAVPPPAAPTGVPADAQQATVARIVDGDTLELAATAPGPATQIDVRLLEINTPETQHPDKPVQCYGAEATAHLTQLAPVGSTVWIQRDQEIKDQYGRYLLYLWNEQGTFVNLALVRDGYAEAVLYRPNDKHWNTISAAETNAQQVTVGLWGACDHFGSPAHTPEATSNPQPQPDLEPNIENNDSSGDYRFPPPPPDKDCSSIAASSFPVRPGDPHRFDRDGDGIGCEG